MSDLFTREFQEVTEGLRQAELARAMAQKSGRDPRSLVGSLSRMRRGTQTPKTEMIGQIAEAVGSLKQLSRKEVNSVRERLARAAHPEDWRIAAELDLSEAEHRRRLYPVCREILRRVRGLPKEQIDQILNNVGVSTMKLIIAADKRGEEIEVVALQELSAELPQPGEALIVEEKDNADNVINAGRARILVDGEVSPAQMNVLRNAAEMIESVLKL